MNRHSFCWSLRLKDLEFPTEICAGHGWLCLEKGRFPTEPCYWQQGYILLFPRINKSWQNSDKSSHLIGEGGGAGGWAKAENHSRKISLRAADSWRGTLLAPKSKCKSLIQGHFFSILSLRGVWTPSKETSQQPKSLKSLICRVHASPSGWQ